MFSETTVLRALAAAAAATAIAGAVVMRHWDAQAGRRVADLTRARASDEWRFEERVAELESDLEESRELRGKLEQRLRAKRAELAGLRNEHASLLRRYATAETERASALEGRRRLELEAVAPAPALPAARAVPAQAGPVEPDVTADPEADENGGPTPDGDAERAQAPSVFSPKGSRLFLRAGSAAERLEKADATGADASERDGRNAEAAEPAEAAEDRGVPEDTEEAEGADEAEVHAEGEGGGTRADHEADAGPGPHAAHDTDTGTDTDTDIDGVADTDTDGAAETDDDGGDDDGGGGGREADAAADPAPQDEGRVRPEAADGHQRAESASDQPGRPDQPDQPDQPDRPLPDRSGPPAQPTHRASGHFTVPTAVAVAPAAAPARRPAGGGGFDFFGNKTPDPSGPAEEGSETLAAVQNEDLADVVGQEALALHKAEAEAGFKPAGAESRGVGQVIDLTAHDETEQIDVEGLRSAVS
ncbi:hypothetical protein GCM10023220_26590 [Streptomyces ziwulingensis]|uniref:Secreted protein n=1 Tax=Streptomyces ziwulingensis TaxID=1045501 RepID=A0ABP9BR99_9ACTN